MNHWHHFHERGDGVSRAGGSVLGVVEAAGPLYATVAWETGERTEVHQHDPAYAALGEEIGHNVVMERHDFWRAAGPQTTNGRNSDA